MKKNDFIKKLKDKKELVIGVAFVLVIIICLIFFFVNKADKKNSDDNKDKGNTVIDQGPKIEEKDIVSVYGMSKDDAISKVKSIFKSDNFEFTASVNDEAKYVVNVKNIISDNEYNYIVDPVNGSFYEMK